MTASTSDFHIYITDQLADLEEIVTKRMFGGYGLYCGHYFFALLFESRLYFKTDETTRNPYIEADSKPFTYMRQGKPAALKNYLEVPAEIQDDASLLCEWAKTAINVAQQQHAIKTQAKHARSRRKQQT